MEKFNLIEDLIINGDDWNHFDYLLNNELTELNQIDYNATPDEWKKCTLAYNYLFLVEKLLIEKKSLEIISGELENLLKNYDNMKAFLLGIRLATIAYRSGIIPKLVQSEFEKKEKSLHTREIKKIVIRKAVENVLHEFPNRPKTLGFVWSKFDFVNDERVFHERKNRNFYRVKTGKDSSGKDIIRITKNGSQQIFEYSKRSLQHFIDDLKNQPSHITQ